MSSPTSLRLIGQVGAVLVCALVLSGCATREQQDGAPVILSDPLYGTPSSLPVSARPPTGVYGNLLAGQQAERHRDWDAASVYMSQAHDSRPEDADLLNASFFAAISAGDFDKANRLSVLILKTDSPDNWLPAAVRASYEFAHQTTEPLPVPDAHPSIANFSEVDPDGLARFTKPLFAAWGYAVSGQYDDAIAALDPIEQIEGLETLAYLQKSFVHEYFDNAQAAEDAMQQAEENGISLRLSEYASGIYERNGNLEAVRNLHENMEKNPSGISLVEISRQRINTASPPPQPTARQRLADGLTDIAGLLQNQGAIPIALVYARMAEMLDPDDAGNLSILGALHIDDMQYEKANSFFARVGTDSYLYTLALERQADIHEYLERPEQALNLLQDIVSLHPDWLEPRIRIGDVLRRSEKYERAIKVYEDVLNRIDALEEQDWAVFYALGICYEQTGKWQKAEDALLTALELNPNDPYVLNYLGYTWADKGQNIDKAMEFIRRALELRPQDGYITDSLGWVYYRLGRYDEAVTYLERAVVLAPNDPIINDHLGEVYWQVRRYNEARYQWERALGLSPSEELADEIRQKLKKGLKAPEKNNI